MWNVLIKGVPEDVNDKLKKFAKEKKISRNQLIIQLIEKMTDEEAEQEKRKERLKCLKVRKLKLGRAV